MQRTTGNIIADSLESAVSYADRLRQDIPHIEAARFARPGGHMVSSNHPCFIFGHLSLYPPKVLGQLNQKSLPIPAGFEKTFDKTATCQDDPNHTVYPSFDEVLAFFSTGHKKLIETLRGTPNEAFDHPNPAEGPLAERFPTLSSVHAFYCGGHIMSHLGQLSAWRRMQGLPPA